MSDRKHPCLTVMVAPACSEEMPWTLQDLGAEAVEERDEFTMTAVEKGRKMFIAGFSDIDARERAVDELRKVGGSVEAWAVDVCDDGWSSGWKKFFKAVELDSLRIVTPWMDLSDDARVNIVIDPGLAFGTGGHPTTRLILKMLERRAADGLLADTALDVGAGSGILSIAAVKLGVSSVTGVDIDEESPGAVRDNAAANGVAERVHVSRGTPADLDGHWPLVLANMELSVFLEHALEIARLVGPEGEVLVSGLLEEQVGKCAALWPGFHVTEDMREEGWAALALRRSP